MPSASARKASSPSQLHVDFSISIIAVGSRGGWHYLSTKIGRRLGRAFGVAQVVVAATGKMKSAYPSGSMLENFSRKCRWLRRGLTVILSRCGSRCRWVSCRSRELAIAKQEKFGCAWFRAQSAWTKRQVPSQDVAVQSGMRHGWWGCI